MFAESERYFERAVMHNESAKDLFRKSAGNCGKGLSVEFGILTRLN